MKVNSLLVHNYLVMADVVVCEKRVKGTVAIQKMSGGSKIFEVSYTKEKAIMALYYICEFRYSSMNN